MMMQPLVISTFYPFPTLSLSLPSSTPIESLADILSPLCPTSLQSLSTTQNVHLSPTSTAPLSSLLGVTTASSSLPAPPPTLFLRLSVKLHGGKGGFASQLRAQGGRMSSNKATNNDSCRDLNGRRLSTIKEAQKLATYIQSAPDRERAQRDQAQAKLDALNLEIARLAGGDNDSGKKRRLDDHEFVEQSREIVEGVKDAVKLAMLKKRRKNKEKENKAVTSEGEGTELDIPHPAAAEAGSSKDVEAQSMAVQGAVSEAEAEEDQTEAETVEEENAPAKGKGKGKARAAAVKGKGKAKA